MLVEVNGILEEHPLRDLLVNRNGKWVQYEQPSEQPSKSHRAKRRVALIQPRYCIVCHVGCSRSRCPICGRHALRNEDIDRVPLDEPPARRGSPLIYIGLPDTKRSKH